MRPVTVPPTGAATNRPHGRAVIVPRHRPGYVGRLHGVQLLIVELTVFGALSALAYHALAAAGAALVAVAIVALTLARWRGRWLFERRVMVWRYRRRRRLAGTAGPPTAALSVLHRLSPDLRVENVTVAGRQPVGVARDDAGWFAAATIVPSVLAGPREDVPLDLLASSVAEADQAGAVVQVVIETVPAPAAAPTSAAERSYDGLLAAVGSRPPLADRITWVAVRIDAHGLAEAIGDYNADISSAPAVVGSLLRRVVTSLRQVGVTAHMLDADGLLSSLARSCDAQPAADGAASHERWSTWRSRNLAYRTFWVRAWPALGRAPALFDALLAVPTATTTVSVVLDPDPRSGLVDLTALVRVGAAVADLERTARSMVRAARSARAHLFALDGEHGPGVYASAPTGGGAR
jgi:type VII secretion protein EccE